MDACIWVAGLLICGIFFLLALMIGAALLVLGLIGGGLLAIVIGVGAIMQGDLKTGAFLLVLGIVMISIGGFFAQLAGKSPNQH